MCGPCRTVLCWEHKGPTSNPCPVCSQPVQTTLKVFFAGVPVEAPRPPQPVAAFVKEMQLAKPSPHGVILALTDGKSVEQVKLDEVELIEAWADQWPDPQALPLAEAMRLMELTVPQSVHELLDAGREPDYARAVLAECSRLWRAMALRLHPDKSSPAATKFWSKGGREERLQEAFKYCANLRDHIQKSVGCYLVERVSAARINYWLTDANALSLQVCFDAKPDLHCVVYFFQEDGVEMEVELVEGESEITFNQDEEEYCYMFSPDFEGFHLVHRATCGPHKGVESRAVRVADAIPQELLDAQVQVVLHMEEEEERRCEERRLAAVRRQIEEMTVAAKKRKRAAEKHKSRDNKRRRQQVSFGQREARPIATLWVTPPWRWCSSETHAGRRPKACLWHHPAEQRYCSDLHCTHEHIDTRTKEGARRWQSIQRALKRTRGERE